MFSTDRDLLVLEPRLFHDISWSAQKLLDSASGGAITSGSDILTITGATLISLGITTGAVVLVGLNPATPIEVVERLSDTQLRVSRLRGAPSDPIIPPASGAALKVVVHSFSPQRRLVHDQLLRALGMEPTDPGLVDGADRPGPSDITNPAAFVLAECLGALHLIFSSAAALVGADAALWTKARSYGERFQAERVRLAAAIDLDGDGRPDAVRRPSIMRFIRD